MAMIYSENTFGFYPKTTADDRKEYPFPARDKNNSPERDCFVLPDYCFIFFRFFRLLQLYLSGKAIRQLQDSKENGFPANYSHHEPESHSPCYPAIAMV